MRIMNDPDDLTDSEDEWGHPLTEAEVDDYLDSEYPDWGGSY